MELTVYALSCYRYGEFSRLLKAINDAEGGYQNFCKGFREFGIHRSEDNGITCKEWAPGAEALFLWGDFSKYTSFYITTQRTF